MDKENREIFEAVGTMHEMLRKHPESKIELLEDEIWFLYRKFVLPELEARAKTEDKLESKP